MLDELDMHGKSVVVTGAANGMGRATCGVLAELGARVFAVDIEDGFATRLNAERAHYGDAALALLADVSSEAAISTLVNQVSAEVEEIAAVVNIVGGSLRASVAEMDLSEWNRTLAVSLTSVMLMSRGFLPLVERARGSFVNMASTHAFVGLPLGSAYSAAKAGVVGFTRQMATEVGPTGVRVNCVCPGPVDTRGRTGETRPESAMSTVLGRTADPLELANVIAFLASPASSFITGAAIVIDGGQSAHRGLVDRSRLTR